MAVSLQALLNIKASVAGGDQLQRLGAQLAGIGTSAGKTGPPIQAMRSGLQGLAAVAGTVGLGFLGKQLLDAGVAAQAADVRVGALTKQFGESRQLSDLAAEAAQRFALGNVEAKNAVSDLYGRLRPMGVSLEEVRTVFFGVNTAARQMGLSAADTSGVMLQLSQALGSGKLQGDELRSIMEALPAVGQAVAKTMGVPVAAIKELGSQGKITTDIMIRAAEELTKMQLIDPTPVQRFDKAMKDLNTEIGENLLPILVPFIEGLSGLMRTLGALPEPVQTLIVALGALAFIAGPVASAISAIGSAMVVLGPILTGLGSALAAAGTAIAAFVTWPVALGVALVAAIAAIWIFRDQIGAFIAEVLGMVTGLWQGVWDFVAPFREAWMGVAQTILDAFKWGFSAVWALTYQVFLAPWVNLWENQLKAPVTATWKWLGDQFKAIGSVFTSYVVEPITNAWNALASLLPNAMQKAADAVEAVWSGVVNAIKGVINGALNAIGSAINSVIGTVNNVIKGFNKLPGPDIGLIPTVSIPKLAAGGFVDGPTVAMIGDNRSGREYVIPEEKAAGFASNYLAGARGAAAIPTTTGGAGAAPAAGPINITTGPVMELEGSRYVKLEDLERAVQQTQRQILATLRTPGGRRAIGVA
jgi:tape measure domain-containing protein